MYSSLQVPSSPSLYDRQRSSSVGYTNKFLSRSYSPTRKGVGQSPIRRSSNASTPYESDLFRQRTFSMPMHQLSPNFKKLNKKNYNVVLLGSSNVGKNSIASTFNRFHDSSDSENEESPKSFTFIPEEHFDFNIRIFNEASGILHLYKYDGVVVIYSITDESSFEFAKSILNTENINMKTVILVGNKYDLQRSRIVSTSAGKHLAKKHNIKFVETSIPLEMNVDNLHRGLSTQLHLRNGQAAKKKLIDKIISKFYKSKSCLDLHTL